VLARGEGWAMGGLEGRKHGCACLQNTVRGGSIESKRGLNDREYWLGEGGRDSGGG
jgi:hypothetical protein